MLKGIQKLFGKASSLFGYRQDNYVPSANDELRNFDEEAVKEEFRQRFLNPLAPTVCGELQFENMIPALAYVKTLPLTAPLMALLAVSGVGAPVALAVSAVVAVSYAFVAAPRANQALEDASNEITWGRNHNKNSPPGAVDTWLAKHIDQIPEYLDRLDRREEDLRKRKTLLRRIENGAAQATLRKEDRDLLARYDPHKFKTRAENPFSLLPHQSILGNWHYTRLSNALRTDIRSGAGAKGSPLRQLLTIGR